MTDFCRLTREQATLYQAVVDDLLRDADEAEGIDRRGRVLAGLLRLKQVCNHPAQYLSDGSPLAGRSGKLTRVEELLDEILAEGDRVLCFTQFAEWGHLLQPYLARRFGTDPLWLHGGVPRRKRDDMVHRFQADDGEASPILLVSLKAGGTGLNLTAASHVIHLDRWWNPAVEDQATDRAYRIGQQRTVLVHKLVCAGTVEERIDEMITRKRALAERVVGTGEDWLTVTVDRRPARPRGAGRRRGGGRVMPRSPWSSESSGWGGGRPPWFEPSAPLPVEGGLATSKQRGRDGGHVVVAAVRAGPRVLRPRGKTAAGPPLRPQGPGDHPRRRGRAGDGRGPGQPARALPGDHRVARARAGGLGVGRRRPSHDERAWRRGSWPERCR